MIQVSLAHFILMSICVYHHCVSCYPRHRLGIIHHSTSISSTSYADLFCLMVIFFIFTNNAICAIHKKTIFR